MIGIVGEWQSTIGFLENKIYEFNNWFHSYLSVDSTYISDGNLKANGCDDKTWLLSHIKRAKLVLRISSSWSAEIKQKRLENLAITE